MSVLYPLGIESDGGGLFGTIKKVLGPYLFVNPEKMTINRVARISDARTMGGTVFQPWPNMPDEVKFEGILFGIRSIYEISLLSDAINSSPDLKGINLIYKWKRYKGFLRNLSVAAEASKPRQASYSFDFVGRDAISLYKVLVGQLTGSAVEAAFVQAQLHGASDAVKSGLLNNVISVVSIGADSSGRALTLGAQRLLFLLGMNEVFNLGRGKKYNVGSEFGKNFKFTL